MNQAWFAKHETFYPRFSWLKKGFDKSAENSNIFLEKNAPTVLGVGKNMVKAIKYWSIAYKILQTTSDKKIIASHFGKQLFGVNGWDPYLEDPASLWLLHWNLLKTPCYATTWFYVYNVFNRHVFTVEDIVTGLNEYKEGVFPLAKISTTSLLTDISCFLRMYLNLENKNELFEDSIDSPFIELDLIKNYGDNKHYTFNFDSKTNLAPEVLVAVSLEFAGLYAKETKTINISRLLYEEGSPGKCFKIKEDALCDAIEKISIKFNDINLSETAGLIQFSYNNNPINLSKEILKYYYHKRG
jgi:hypothetical protein